MALTIQNYLQNCTAVIEPPTVETNSNVFITITANNGYILDNMPFFYISLNGWQVSKRFENFTYNENKTVATININLATEFTTSQQNNLQYLRLYGQAQALPTNIVDVEIETANNCNVTAPTSVDTLNENLSITITANENYIFETPPQLTITGGEIQDNYNFVLSEDSKTATINFIFSDHYESSELDDILGIFVNATANPEIIYRNYGAINVYKVNDTILNQFAAKRFQTTQLEKINLGENVITIKKYFFNISNTVPNNIKCANYDTLISASTPLENIFIFDCGNITILPEQNNALDFENEMKIFLPFYGFANFSNDYINKEINLKYYINIVTAKGEIKLFYNSVCVESWQITPCIDVNFKFLNYDNLENNSNDLKGLTPYIIVKRFNGFCSDFNSDNRNVIIRNLTANKFYKFDNITNLNLPVLANKSALETEYNLIIQQLKDGVII